MDTELDQEDTIKLNLETYMSYIEECVPPIDLAGLPYFTKTQRQDLFIKSSQRPQKATRKALMILINKDDPGRFVNLKQTMEAKGFPKVVNMLSGRHVKDANYRRIIEIFADKVTNQLDPVEVLPYLLKYEVLSQRDAEEVRAEEVNYGKIRASWILLPFLPKRLDNWFKYFLMSLIDCGSGALAKILDDDLYEKICVRRSEAQQQEQDSIHSDYMDYFKDESTTYLEAPCETTTATLNRTDETDADILNTPGETPTHKQHTTEESNSDNLKCDAEIIARLLNAPDETAMTLLKTFDGTTAKVRKMSDEITTMDVLKTHDETSMVLLKTPDETFVMELLKPHDETSMELLKTTDETCVVELLKTHDKIKIESHNTSSGETVLMELSNITDETSMTLLKTTETTGETTTAILKPSDETDTDILNSPGETHTNKQNTADEANSDILQICEEITARLLNVPDKTAMKLQKNFDGTTAKVRIVPDEINTMDLLKTHDGKSMELLNTPDETCVMELLKTHDEFRIESQNTSSEETVLMELSNITDETSMTLLKTDDETSNEVLKIPDETTMMPKYAESVVNDLPSVPNVTGTTGSVVHPAATVSEDTSRVTDSSNDTVIHVTKYADALSNDAPGVADLNIAVAVPNESVSTAIVSPKTTEGTEHDAGTNESETAVAFLNESIKTTVNCPPVNAATAPGIPSTMDVSNTDMNVVTELEVSLRTHSPDTDVLATEDDATVVPLTESSSMCLKEPYLRRDNTHFHDDELIEVGFDGTGKEPEENVTKDEDTIQISDIDIFTPVCESANPDVDGTKRKVLAGSNHTTIADIHAPDKSNDLRKHDRGCEIANPESDGTKRKVYAGSNYTMNAAIRAPDKSNDLSKHDPVHNYGRDDNVATRRTVADYISQDDIESLAKAFDSLQMKHTEIKGAREKEFCRREAEMIYERIDRSRCSEEVMNIPTDADELESTDDTDIRLYGYQEELARLGCEGENVIIMAPTNTGKTWVACKIIQEHFRRNRGLKICKVAFIVDNEALADQQARVIAELVKNRRSKVISGTRQREKKEYLTDFIDRRDVLVVTAQILVNALSDNGVESVGVFSLIVFDECHHATADHPYNVIMRHYMDMKMAAGTNAADLTQIIGLTASVGCGGNSALFAAIDHIKGLMANLDAKSICTVRDPENVEELNAYITPPYEEIVITPNRANDIFRQRVTEVMIRLENWMHTHESVNDLQNKDKADLKKTIGKSPPLKGTEQYIQWLSDFDKTIVGLQSDTQHLARRFLNNCKIHLDDYNRALLLYKDARVEDALDYLEDQMLDRRSNPLKDVPETRMLQFYEDLTTMPLDDNSCNPKLTKLAEILLGMLKNKEDARGIVFVRTRVLALAIIDWMRDDDRLKLLNPNEFVGQNAPASAGGSTKSQQRNILDYFKDGKHKVIVATSVADEGLDIAKCNLVIRYEHVTNEIVRLQSRGRARAPGSKYYVITEQGSPIADKEEMNARLEPVMIRAVDMLQTAVEARPNSWEREIQLRQTGEKTKRDAAAKRRKDALIHGECEMQCFKCGQFICMSSDIKKIQTMHVIIDDEVGERVSHTRNPLPEFEDAEFKSDGDVFCRKCNNRLGGVCEYRGLEFPIATIQNFRVVDKNNKAQRFAKWTKVKGFVVENITSHDLLEIVKHRISDFD